MRTESFPRNNSTDRRKREPSVANTHEICSIRTDGNMKKVSGQSKITSEVQQYKHVTLAASTYNAKGQRDITNIHSISCLPKRRYFVA
jgi:hypothetical protein